MDGTTTAITVGAVGAGLLAVWLSGRKAAAAGATTGLRGTVCCRSAAGRRVACPSDLTLAVVASDGSATDAAIDTTTDPATWSATVPAGSYTIIGQGRPVAVAIAPGVIALGVTIPSAWA